MKYRPEFPDRFGSQEDAHAFCETFFDWYCNDHYHSGIGMLTPAMVHYGRADEVLARRQKTLDIAFAAHPERFVRKPPVPLALPETVWINPPASHKKGLPADNDGKPDAPSAHPRPGYPSSSCVPAELASVLPGMTMLPETSSNEYPPSDTRAMPPKIPGPWGLTPIPKNRSQSETNLH